jgi:hypothetical protein
MKGLRLYPLKKQPFALSLPKRAIHGSTGISGANRSFFDRRRKTGRGIM